MAQRETLADLYKAGDVYPIVQVDDDDTVVKTIHVWVQKLLPKDHQAVMNRSNAARAKVMAETRDHDSDLYLMLVQGVHDLGDDPAPIIERLANIRVAERIETIQAEIDFGEHSEWAKEGYLRGLQDAWNGDETVRGLKETWQHAQAGDDSVDPERVAEANRIWDELTRYLACIETAQAAEIDAAKRYFETESLDSLRAMLIEEECKHAGNLAWATAFKLNRLFHSTFDAAPDGVDGEGNQKWKATNRRHFDDFESLENSHDRIKAQLLAAVEDISLDGTAVKGLQRPVSSSTPTGQSVEEETLVSSGPTGEAA